MDRAPRSRDSSGTGRRLLDESPLGRVSRSTARGATAFFGALGLISFFDANLASLRPVALAVGGLAALVALVAAWLSRR
jgi:hypothetical protein